MIKIASNKNREVVKSNGIFVGYLLAGYPNNEDFISLVKKVSNTKMDVLEIGFPSDNPIADGDIIRRAHEKVDLNLCQDIEYWKLIRKCTTKPIWLMAYKRDFIDSNLYKEFARNKVMDAIVIPDCIHEEHNQLEQELKEFNVDVLKFIRSTLKSEEIKKRAADASLLYAQLHDGPTGASNVTGNYHSMLKTALEYSDAKIFAGFGIDSKEKVDELFQQGFHGVVIGTAMIRMLNISEEELIKFINAIKANVS
ncbi:MAG: tryptophan synthase subunit alpha [Thermoanaerobacteraceae bacterium]|nr:tryptophan synthase subunit alpha [Thermoanaerobacteraceae bacterium]